ncbi:hypothetical protein M501DRAFT_941241 [Patellaria atrata CBS 101060]|uniref:Nab2-like CCCH zinc finger domain-containing protein n=1 Tax=Patellaria atrata CBS 101060 TaxID=1346257 RepID=A0A9P4VLI5_9PEZI|nr:hypothetical protein M501DRAFT_941241 [Patellaria atrata CBS 101060]
MSVEVALDSPLAKALQNVVNPKLAEVGWASGDAGDSTLAEYIVLMLSNGKNQEDIATELSTDLLVDTSGAIDFARWLFEQVNLLNFQINGSAEPSHSGSSNAPIPSQSETTHDQSRDAEMGDSNDGNQTAIPTGPKAMRNGNSKPRGMLGQVNKAMSRNDNPLHRIKGAGGAGRINSHSNREPPKGPRNQAINRGFQMASAIPMQQMQPNGMPNFMGAPPDMTNMNPEQRMQMLKFFEFGSSMMAQFYNVAQPPNAHGQAMGGPVFNPAFQNGTQGPQPGKSLFDRVDNRSQRRGGKFNNTPRATQPQQQDVKMGDDPQPTTDDQSSSMDVETSAAVQKDPPETMCRFNLYCTKSDCPFAHQSPAAPPGVNVDISDVCTFGAACKNKKCVGRHPSPAKKLEHHAQQPCKFWPDCTNEYCPFQHTPKRCTNGADCVTPGCQFAHSKIVCRFNPCTRPQCPYKHSEGQKRGAFEDKVWKANSGKEHVSERKFVNEEEEELILPGAGNENSDPVEPQIIT